MKNRKTILRIIAIALIVLFFATSVSLAIGEELKNDMDMETELIMLNSRINSLERRGVIRFVLNSILVPIIVVIITIIVSNYMERKHLLSKNKSIAKRLYNEINMTIESIIRAYQKNRIPTISYNFLNEEYLVDINMLANQLNSEEIKALNLFNYNLDMLEANRARSVEMLKEDKEGMEEFIINIHTEAIDRFYEACLFREKNLMNLIDKLERISGSLDKGTLKEVDLNKHLRNQLDLIK